MVRFLRFVTLSAGDDVYSKGSLKMKFLSRAKSFCKAAILTIPLFLCSNLLSQVDTGTILGTIRDSSNSVVPGATITLTNENMGVSIKATTNADGNYQFPGLRVGAYSITAENAGFAKVEQKNLSLSIQQRLVIDLTLQP